MLSPGRLGEVARPEEPLTSEWEAATLSSLENRALVARFSRA
jgi:hypothetical protein